MGDFIVDNIWGIHDDEGTFQEADNFAWWALGHNFDVVATILAMAELSWQKGFDAGRVIAEFNEVVATSDGADLRALLFGQDSGN